MDLNYHHPASNCCPPSMLAGTWLYESPASPDTRQDDTTAIEQCATRNGQLPPEGYRLPIQADQQSVCQEDHGSIDTLLDTCEGRPNIAELHQRAIQEDYQYNGASLSEGQTRCISSKEPQCRQPVVRHPSTLPACHFHNGSAHSRTWSQQDDNYGYNSLCSGAGPGEGCRPSSSEPTAAPGTAVRATATDLGFPTAPFSALQHVHHPPRQVSCCSNPMGANMIGNPAPVCPGSTPASTIYIMCPLQTCYPLPASQQPPAEYLYRQWPV